jgi:hypothetical protein
MADYLGAIYDEVAVILSTTYEDFRDYEAEVYPLLSP